MNCQCRNCGKTYQEHKSRAPYKGYCTAKCAHDKAKNLGFKKRPYRLYRGQNTLEEYAILKRANEIGSIYIYMNKYTADIGCWDHGKNVDLPNSHTLDGALDEAEQILAITTFSKPITDPYIVQIKLNGQPIWDYMNGALQT